jgi:hypothetical protein
VQCITSRTHRRRKRDDKRDARSNLGFKNELEPFTRHLELPGEVCELGFVARHKAVAPCAEVVDLGRPLQVLGLVPNKALAVVGQDGERVAELVVCGQGAIVSNRSCVGSGRGAQVSRQVFMCGKLAGCNSQQSVACGQWERCTSEQAGRCSCVFSWRNALVSRLVFICGGSERGKTMDTHVFVRG